MRRAVTSRGAGRDLALALTRRLQRVHLRTRPPGIGLGARGVLRDGAAVVLAHGEADGVAAADGVAVLAQEHEEALRVPTRIADLDESEALLADAHDLALQRLPEGEHACGHAVLSLDERRPRHEEHLGPGVQL